MIAVETIAVTYSQQASTSPAPRFQTIQRVSKQYNECYSCRRGYRDRFFSLLSVCTSISICFAILLLFDCYSTSDASIYAKQSTRTMNRTMIFAYTLTTHSYRDTIERHYEWAQVGSYTQPEFSFAYNKYKRF